MLPSTNEHRRSSHHRKRVVTNCVKEREFVSDDTDRESVIEEQCNGKYDLRKECASDDTRIEKVSQEKYNHRSDDAHKEKVSQEKYNHRSDDTPQALSGHKVAFQVS